MLVNKKALALKAALGEAPGKYSRYNLDCLKLTENKAIATDAKLLIELENPSQELIKDFPDTVKGPDTAVQAKEAYLTKTILDKIEKNLPKNPVNPLMENFLVMEDKDTHKIRLSDLDSNIEISQRKLAIKYPDTPEYLYQAKDFKNTNTTLLSITELEKLIKVVKKVKHENVGVRFYVPADSSQPIIFEFKEPDADVSLKGLLMPMREGM